MNSLDNRACKLVRVEEHPTDGTFGALCVDGHAFCVTLEPPDRNNEQGVSNIPPGIYTCKRFHSIKHPDTFQVMHVPLRSAILFHSGNIVSHTEGCILLAQYFGKLRGNRAVLNSGRTFERFLQLMLGYNEFPLEIVEA